MENDPIPSNAQPIERRLATILMADVAGYSRMMGENEEGTVAVLRGHREIFDALLKAHRGRVFNTAGDAILAEFPSAVEAVRCATEIQTALRTRNEHLPPEQRMWFRIGINLGDVIVQGDDLLGDGVNVAARIQTIAEPGGVCISGSVYDQIQNKLTLQIKQLGEKNFKNIAQPIRTFSISDDGSLPAPGARWRRLRKGPIIATVVGLIALLASAAVASWLYQDYSRRAEAEARQSAEAQRAAEAQRKSDLDKTAQHEAKLLAELQAAKDALTQAETSKRKAEQDRAVAEAAQREARLQTEIRSARDAQQRAEASAKKADEERRAAAETLRVAAAEAKAAKATAEAPASKSATAKAAEPKPASAAAQVAAAQSGATASGKGVERFDGAYLGRMCSIDADNSPRCWRVALQVQNGTLSSTWMSRFNNNASHAKGTIAADGTVTLALDGYTVNGRALAGNISGSWADNAISATGAWGNGVPVTANWTRAR